MRIGRSFRSRRSPIVPGIVFGLVGGRCCGPRRVCCLRNRRGSIQIIIIRGSAVHVRAFAACGGGGGIVIRSHGTFYNRGFFGSRRWILHVHVHVHVHGGTAAATDRRRRRSVVPAPHYRCCLGSRRIGIVIGSASGSRCPRGRNGSTALIRRCCFWLWPRSSCCPSCSRS